MLSLVARWWFYPLVFVISIGVVFLGVLGFTLALIYPTLPSLDALTDYRPKIPLRIYSADNILVGEFGEERRAVVKIAEVPELMKRAILAAEDERFYSHGGVDYQGVARAMLANLTAGGAKEGASTITMQVARNFFLSNEKTFTRKLSEVLLSFKIEKNLSKDQILELYINQIFLGQRAYGFAAAANTYFGKSLKDLTPAEAAMLAGLPKAPSRFNPVVNPKRAVLRQRYVLRRMRDLGYLEEERYQAAIKQPLRLAAARDASSAVAGDYVSEMARQAVFEQFGDATYTGGYRVYTTIRKVDQDAAYAALRKGVIDYDHRHGYRGPEGFADLGKPKDVNDEVLEDALQDKDTIADLVPAVVLEASSKHVKLYIKGGELVTINGDGLKFAARSIGDKVTESTRIRRGAIVRVTKEKDEKGNWQILQLPSVEAALVSVDPSDGAIRALVGGFDFNLSKFNHVSQAWRQPGSSFKPFIYSAALEKGYTPATVINDAPVFLEAAKTGSGEAWEPKNYDGKYDGPMRIRAALAKSKNMVSIRVLQGIGPAYAQDYVTRFGFDPKLHPAYLSMALGAGSATPLQMAGAYSVFANGGYRIKPYYILKVLDGRGATVLEAKPETAGQNAERVIDPRNAFIMTSLMRDVVRFGTATKAMSLGRQDLAGKTGTTNDLVDAWFTGFQPKLVAVAWIGFDTPKNMGSGETGGQAALPIWMGYMGKVLKGVPEEPFTPPEGVVTVPINPSSGLRDEAGIPEFFYQEFTPGTQDSGLGLRPSESEKPQEEIKNQLF
ncbi:MAG: penicillin-binding protein 1A [Pseudomonadota bacterium]